MRVRGADAEVHVVAVRDDASVVVGVEDYGSVWQPMLVLVRMVVFMIVAVVVAAVRPMNVLVPVRVILSVIVPVHRAVRMLMLVSVLVAFDLRFAAAATACRAHTVLLGPPQAISISFTRISSPCTTCSW